jgi:hypothetical protein
MDDANDFKELGVVIKSGGKLYHHLMEITTALYKGQSPSQETLQKAQLQCRIWDDTVHGIRAGVAKKVLGA